MSNNNKIEVKEVKEVAVTGGSGFIASQLIQDLLSKGYKVRATVRNPNDPVKTQHLISLPHSENLTLHQADLLDGVDTFKPIFQGCDVVFHTASPFHFNYKDPEELIAPAIQGTANVLTAALSVGVKHIILTSSIASIIFNSSYFSPRDKEVTEEEWSDVDVMTAKGLIYPKSKTLAEREAWKLVDQFNIDHPHEQVRLVTINPGYVIGPLLQSTLNTSSSILLDYLTGKKTEIQKGFSGFVDVRDVSSAHILAYENKEAKGRYLCVSEILSFNDICEKLRAIKDIQSLNPPHSIPTKEAEGVINVYQVNTSKLRSLEWKPLSISQSIDDSLSSLVSHYNAYFHSK